jgi:hypothetical protein
MPWLQRAVVGATAGHKGGVLRGGSLRARGAMYPLGYPSGRGGGYTP